MRDNSQRQLLATPGPLQVVGASGLRALLAAYGRVEVVFALPVSAMRQDVWTPVRGVAGEPGGWGQHQVTMVEGYERTFVCLAWGDERQVLTADFLRRYCLGAIASRKLQEPSSKLQAEEEIASSIEADVEPAAAAGPAFRGGKGRRRKRGKAL